MTDLAITTTKPTASTNKPKKIQVGEAVSEGDFGYKSGSKYFLANNLTLGEAAATCIFLNSALLDGYANIHTIGEIDIGVTTVANTFYVTSAIDGQAAPNTDLATSAFVTLLFIGSGTSVINFKPQPTGTQAP